MSDEVPYLIMRKRQRWNDISPIFYLGDKNPNKHLVQEGAKVIIEKEFNGEIKFMGYAEIDYITRNTDPKYTDHQSIVYFKNYVKFFPPRPKNEKIRESLRSIRDYRWYDSIRLITKPIYHHIVDSCYDDWELYMEEFAPEQLSTNLDIILRQEESQFLEFKSTMLYPIKPTKKISSLEQQIHISKTNELMQKLEEEKRIQLEDIKQEIVQTVAAFLNARGGILVIGYDNDNKEVVGIEHDFKFLREKSWDAWLRRFGELLGTNFKTNKEIIPHLIPAPIPKENQNSEVKTVVKLDIPASNKPIFVGENDDFYIRYFNTTQKLSPKQFGEYAKTRWRDTALDNHLL